MKQKLKDKDKSWQTKMTFKNEIDVVCVCVPFMQRYTNDFRNSLYIFIPPGSTSFFRLVYTIYKYICEL